MWSAMQLAACSKGSRWLLKGDIEAGIARVKRLQNGIDSNLARHSFF